MVLKEPEIRFDNISSSMGIEVHRKGKKPRETNIRLFRKAGRNVRDG